MFDVGQKVVCVNGKFPASVVNYLENLPREGEIYTVRDVKPGQEWKGEETCAVLLEEVVNPPPAHKPEWGECGFAPHRFRELSTEALEAIEELQEAADKLQKAIA